MVLASIPCFIAEDHHEVLPFYFYLAKHKKISMASAPSMIHFDSHPDLSMPKSSTNLWHSAHSLFYDVLITQGCIAEWLMPLLYSGVLSKVVWLRNADQCKQLEKLPIDLDVVFQCGDSVKDGTAACTLRDTYFMDDSSYCELGALKGDTVRPVLIHISSLPSQDQYHVHNEHKMNPVGPGEWVLDICLDFFHCCNPFLEPILTALQADLDQPPFSATQRAVDWSPSSALAAVQTAFFSLPPDPLERAAATADLERLLESDEHDLEASSFSSVDGIADLLSRLSASTRALILQASHCINLPHFSASICSSTGIPAAPSTPSTASVSIDDTLRAMKDYLSTLASATQPPKAISIARSADDGFTPKETAEELLEKVLEMLRALASTWGLGVEVTDVIQIAAASNQQLRGTAISPRVPVDACTVASTMFLNKRAAELVQFRHDPQDCGSNIDDEAGPSKAIDKSKRRRIEKYKVAL